MSKNYALKADKKDRAGKGPARALRRAGKIPAIVYGDNKEPLSIALPANDVDVEYHKGHMFTNLCELEVEGEKLLVLARDIQVHPVSDIVQHADFLRVNERTRIAVNVPVHFINEDKSPGLREGGILNVMHYEIELYCSAMAIPEAVEVDMAGTNIGDSVSVGAVALPEGTRPEIEGDFDIASIVAPRSIEEIEAELAEGAEAPAAEGGEGAAEGEEGEAAGEEGEDKAEKE